MNKMRIKKPVTIEVMVPAGKYFIGDPCYAVDQDDWPKLLDTCDCFNSPVGMLPDEYETEVLAFGTRWGDGTYIDGHGRYYDVDSGLIGLVPLEAVNAKNVEEFSDAANSLGHVVEFKTNVTCRCNSDTGMLTFGHISIDTDPGPDED